MTTPPRAGESTTSEEPLLEARVARVLERTKDIARHMLATGRVLAPFAKPNTYKSKKSFDTALAKLERSLAPGMSDVEGVRDVLDALRERSASAAEALREEIGSRLAERCSAAGVTYHVESRENPIEIRLAPLVLRVDLESGVAELRFAKCKIADCRPDAVDILESRAAVLADFESDRDLPALHARFHAAYRAALGVKGLSEGARVEILEFLPLLVALNQSPKFKVEPITKNFKPYERARFAYDIWRLRRDNALVQGGMRLNLGVATGSSATDKRRVVYLEDADGDGEYKLTVLFTREETTHP